MLPRTPAAAWRARETCLAWAEAGEISSGSRANDVTTDPTFEAFDRYPQPSPPLHTYLSKQTIECGKTVSDTCDVFVYRFLALKRRKCCCGMADDPYNFEIDIPAAASGGASYGRGRYDDSEEGESSGGSSEAMSDLDDEDEDEESLEQPRKIKPAASKPVARAAPAVATRGGGDALDKAKSFLSKYTAKPVETKASSASSRRCVRVCELADPADKS